MSKNGKRRAIICSQSNFTTDYRIEKMRRTLTDCGYEVTLLGRSHPHERRASAHGVHYMRLLFWHGLLFYAELNLRLALHLLLHRRADLVVAIDLDTLPGCLLGARLRGERLMFDSHELFPEVPEIAGKPFVKKVWWALQDFCVPLLRRTDVRVTVCQSIADVFARRYGAAFRVVRNVPLAGRTLAPVELREVKGRPFTLLYQGAVNVGRGVEEVIQALPRLEGCRFVVVGDGDVMGRVRQMAADLGVADRVEFVGRVPFDRLSPYMAGADLGIVMMKNISLNQYYALPNRIFDFIQAGLPILANSLPEISRIVEGDDVGMCIDTLSASSVAEAVKSIIANPDWRVRWHANMLSLSHAMTWQAEVGRKGQGGATSLADELKQGYGLEMHHPFFAAVELRKIKWLSLRS